MSNPDITPLAQNQQSTANTTAGTVPAPGLVNVQWFVDNTLPDNYLYYYNQQAILFFQGPSRSSNYRDELLGQSGVIYHDWFNAATNTTVSGFGRKMTGIAP
jgi:hypothetical protein